MIYIITIIFCISFIFNLWLAFRWYKSECYRSTVEADLNKFKDCGLDLKWHETQVEISHQQCRKIREKNSELILEIERLKNASHEEKLKIYEEIAKGIYGNN